MLNTYFSEDQLTPLLISGVILITAIFTFRKSENLGLSLLVIGAIFIGYFAGNLNHYLELWDEQFHALVAKNMSSTPLTPRLFPEAVLPYNYTHWTYNYIWLHKQPMFLWQMALSIKLFGANEMAIRIPSILLHAVIPLFVYRIGKISIGKEVGFIAAVLITTSYFPLELITGEFATDHNDISFLFYVTGSFWAWFEYQRSKEFKYIVFLGLFAGGAVLVKWLMGLIVYVIWTITNLLSLRLATFKKEHILPMIQSSFVSLLVFLPWQIYIHLKYPKEASYELGLNGQHFFQAVEGHTGNFSYHFNEGLSTLYGSGDAIPFMILVGLILLIWKSNNLKMGIFIGVSVVFVYVFFSIAATKMLAFTIIVMPFLYLGLATLISFTIQLISEKLKRPTLYSIVIPAITILLGYTAINLNRLESKHTNKEPKEKQDWSMKTDQKELILDLKRTLNDGKYVIFNCNLSFYSNIPIMFYTDHIAYLHVPSREDIDIVKKKKLKIAIYNAGNLPEYILDDNSIRKIPTDTIMTFDY